MKRLLKIWSLTRAIRILEWILKWERSRKSPIVEREKTRDLIGKYREVLDRVESEM